MLYSLLFLLEGWVIYIPHFKLQTFLTLNSQQACLTNIAFSQIHHGCIFFFLSIISSSMSMATLSSIVHWGIWGLQVSLKYDMLCYCIAAKMFSGFIGSVVFLSTLNTINNCWYLEKDVVSDFSEFNHNFPLHLNISMHILPTVNYKIA